MLNPYESPQPVEHPQRWSRADVQARLQVPGGALLLLGMLGGGASIAMIFVMIYVYAGRAIEVEELLGSLWFYAHTGIANAVVIAGARSMLNLRRYRTARAAAVIAMLPICSPLLVLGIPFGMWAFFRLLDHRIKEAFSD